MKTLYELTREAADAVGTYKHPDLDEWKAAIDPVLRAAGQNIIGGDNVTSIVLNDEWLLITAKYTCMGCSNEDYYTLPMAILEAEDPVHAANKLRLFEKFTQANENVNSTKQAYYRAIDDLAKITAEYKEFMRA